MNEHEHPRRKGRLVLLALAALFFVPLSVAVIWFAGVDRLGLPRASVVKGELVSPALPLAEFSLPRAGAAGEVNLDTLRGRWTMVYIGGAECGDRCRESLHNMRQVRLALGKEMDRVQRLYLLVDAENPADPGFFAREHEGMMVARIASTHPLLRQFAVAGVAPAPGRTWIVDPLGNLMMSYPTGAPGQAMLNDLKRLLRLSWIG